MSASLHVMTVVGARPQFVKAAMVSRAIVEYASVHKDSIHESIIHTGQHFDANMSEIFFEQMQIPKPAWNLNVHGGSHGAMTASMLEKIETLLLDKRPDLMLLYGDTNSTLAGALAASKLGVPIGHVEAGLRSFNRQMPEEINRVLTDHLSEFLFCPTHVSVHNLRSEGITSGVFHVGDVMHDAAKLFGALADGKILEDHGLTSGEYFLATCHRAENTDSKERLEAIFTALVQIAKEKPLVLPLHPRTRKMVTNFGLENLLEPLTILPPVSFLDIVALTQSAKALLTDSGGMQKEAYFHRIPCITLRDETEWVETIESGWNQLVGADFNAICHAVSTLEPGRQEIPEYGDGNSSHKIVQKILTLKS